MAVQESDSSTGWLIAGRYRVADRIGSGGMAEVFRAHDELLGRDVAVKVFRTMVDVPEGAAGVERQENELQALARLSHPNLITLFDASLTDKPAYLVMELVDGPSLAARVAADGSLPDAEVRAIGAQIADALAYVHAHDMVHRDVKPANILLGADAVTDDDRLRARLSDFGIVRLLGTERMTAADFTLGTASYLAPEQARGSDVDTSADVYSLGLVLLEALTGVRAFDGPVMEAVMARLSGPPLIPAELSEPWPALLAAMTSSDPAARPAPSAVARILRGDTPAPALLPVPAAVVTSPLRIEDEPPRRRVSALAIVAGVLLALVAGIAALAFSSSSNTPTNGTPTVGHTAPARPHHTSRSSEAAVVPGPTAAVSTSTTAAPPSTSSKATSAPASSSSAAVTTTATTSAPASSPPASSAANTTAAAGGPGPGGTVSP